MVFPNKWQTALLKQSTPPLIVNPFKAKWLESPTATVSSVALDASLIDAPAELAWRVTLSRLMIDTFSTHGPVTMIVVGGSALRAACAERLAMAALIVVNAFPF